MEAKIKKIMVVDDDVGLLHLATLLFKLGGYEVAAFSDARLALDAIDGSCDAAAIVLDLQMPGMDGTEFYRELRARGNNIPVVITSACGALSAKEELGAAAAMDKPFDPEKLLQAVEELLASVASA